MKRLALSVAALAAATTLCSGAIAQTAPKPAAIRATFKGQQLANQAKITLAEARAMALKARPGKIVDQELEKERGGSGLRYSFDIVSHNKTIEVGVDAVTGKILENGSERPAKEAKEAAQEGAPAKH